MDISELVCKTRVEWGLTQEEFGVLLDYSGKYISAIECGRKIPNKTEKKIRSVISKGKESSMEFLQSVGWERSKLKVEENEDCLALVRIISESGLERLTITELLYLQSIVSSLKKPPTVLLLEELILNYRI